MIDLKNKSVQASLIKLLTVVVVLAIVSAVLWKPIINLVSNADNFKSFILSHGAWGPALYITIAALQVLISPIPGQIMGVFSGYTFGWFHGTLYSTLGIMIGSLVAFTLSRRYGRPFVEKVVDKKMLEKFDNLSEDRGKVTLFLIYVLPFMPDDVICFIAGLTNIKIRTLVIISLLGRLPGTLILNLVGAGFSAQTAMTWWMWLIVVLVGIAVVTILIHRERVEHEMMKIVEKSRKK